MLAQMKRFGELVSSNVEALIERAEDPRKMLKLMRAEIEHSLTQLMHEKTRIEASFKRLTGEAAAKSAEAEEWTSKAKLAMDKGREDLARSALLAREADRTKAARMKSEAQEAKAEIAEIEAAIGEMEKRRSEVQAKIDGMPAAAPRDYRPASTTRPSPADKHRGRIDAMEKRAGFAMERNEATERVDPEAIDAELEAMARNSAIDEELAAMRPAKAKSKPRARRKA